MNHIGPQSCNFFNGWGTEACHDFCRTREAVLQILLEVVRMNGYQTDVVTCLPKGRALIQDDLVFTAGKLASVEAVDNGNLHSIGGYLGTYPCLTI